MKFYVSIAFREPKEAIEIAKAAPQKGVSEPIWEEAMREAKQCVETPRKAPPKGGTPRKRKKS